MTHLRPTSPHLPIVVRSDDMEIVGRAPIEIRLLVDGPDTNGALSSQRVILHDGSNGAAPHWHRQSSEFFYVLDGSVQLLAGTEVLTARSGDTIVIPPGLPHAFAATPGHNADLLVVITPSAGRFEYFRQLQRVALGQADPSTLVAAQETFDNYLLHSTEWDMARRTPSGVDK